MHIPKVLIVTDTDATWMAQIFPQKKDSLLCMRMSIPMTHMLAMRVLLQETKTKRAKNKRLVLWRSKST